jgi:hypothetical protein
LKWTRHSIIKQIQHFDNLINIIESRNKEEVAIRLCCTNAERQTLNTYQNLYDELKKKIPADLYKYVGRT